MKKMVALVLILGTLLFTVGWNGYPQKKSATTLWEYKALRGQDVSDQNLNELGAQGWELVSVAAYGSPSKGWSETAYLKRAR